MSLPARSPQPMTAQRNARELLVLYADDWRYDTLGVAAIRSCKRRTCDRSPRARCALRNSSRRRICGIIARVLFTGHTCSRHRLFWIQPFKTSGRKPTPDLCVKMDTSSVTSGKMAQRKFPAAEFVFWHVVLWQTRYKDPMVRKSTSRKQERRTSLRFSRNAAHDNRSCLTVRSLPPTPRTVHADQFLLAAAKQCRCTRRRDPRARQ